MSHPEITPYTIIADLQKAIDLKAIGQIMTRQQPLQLSNQAASQIQQCRQYLDQRLEEVADTPEQQEKIYGINTGFGSLYKHRIESRQDMEQLQVNLVLSHACGAGQPVQQDIVRLMLLLKIQSLAFGHSGVQLATVQRLIDLFNEDLLPVIYEYGSLGASGDLAPLAHLVLPLVGLGEVWQPPKFNQPPKSNQPSNPTATNNTPNETTPANNPIPQESTVPPPRLSGKHLLQLKGWQPVQLQAKEGLALLNGTQFMAAHAVWCLMHAERLLDLANRIGALSLEAFDGRLDPFEHLTHAVRPHQGQQQVAAQILQLLEQSQMAHRPKAHVQDPYSFRCMPQVHGASFDALAYVRQVVEVEINSVTDNPILFPEEGRIISGGNFHGQPLALALDFLAIAMAEVGSISERRTYQLISGARNLPEFLIANPGLNSGLMIPQYTAASIVSANKQLCTPASVDSIPSSNGQEDHVSMGANAATKAVKVVENLYRLLSIELLTATQAWNIREDKLPTSPELQQMVDNFTKKVSFIENDRNFHDDMQQALFFLKNEALPQLL